ncbi:oligosaccharide flippase family protein, partial [Actinoalloteichus caeruleus]
AALVRQPGSGRSAVRPLLPTAWTLSVLWGLVGFLLCLLSAPLLAEALGSPEATGVIRLMSVNVVLDGFAAVPGALLTRELAQARRLVADVSGMALNLAVTGALAVLGAGAWSLAGGNIAGTALVVVLLVVLAGTRPRFGLHRAHAATITRCGAAMLGSSTVLVLAQATPQLVTGTLLGASALGLLYLASNVANWPAAIVTGTVERVALATFSRVRERGGDLSRAVSGVFGLVGVVVLPGGIGLAVLAEPLVLVLYGPDWSPAAMALSGLAVAAVARVVSELVFNLMVAAGALASSVGLQLAWLLALVPFSCVGAWWWGLTGVAWAQAFVAATVALPLQVWGAHRAGVRVRELARGVWPASVLGLVLLLALLALRLTGLTAVVELVVGVVLVGVIVVLGGLRQYRRCRGLLDEPAR